MKKLFTCNCLDLPQVDLSVILDLFIFERRSRKGEREQCKSKLTGQRRIIGKA